MNPFVIIAIGAIVYWSATKANAVATIRSLVYSIQKVEPSCEGFLCLSPILQLTIRIFNPTDNALNLQSISGDVFINGQNIGKMYAFNIPAIQANAPTDIAIKVQGSSITLLTQAVQVIKGQNGPNVTMRITGTANGEGLLVPLDIQYRIL